MQTGAVTNPVNFPAESCTYNWVNSMPAIGLPAAGLGNIASFTAINNGAVPITATITATSNSNDYLYVANSNAGTISVINRQTKVISATINVGLDPDGVVLSPDGGTLYVANGMTGSGTVTLINTATNTVTGTIGNEQGSALTISPNGSFLYVSNTNSNSVSVINTATKFLVTDISVGFSPEGIKVSPDGSRVYVSNAASGTVSIINTLTNTVINTITVGEGNPGFASFLALSPDGTRLYVGNFNSSTVIAVNTITANVIATIPVNSNPYGIAVSPDGKSVYVANRNNSVLVIDVITNSVKSAVIVGAHPVAVSISSDGNSIYAVNAESNSVSVIDIVTNTVIDTYPTGNSPDAIASSPVNNACQPVSFQITVNPASQQVNMPVITTAAKPGTVSTTQGTASPSTGFYAGGTDLTTGILITAPAGFEVSTDNTMNFGPTLTLGAAGTVRSTPVYIRLTAANQAGNYSGNVVLSSNGATPVSINVNGLVTAPAGPVITVNGMLGALLTVYGTASSATTFTASGSALTGDVLVTPPAGFEVSIDDINFGNTVTIPLKTAEAGPTIIYLRLSATAPANIYSHDVVLSSPGATDVHIPTAGSIVTPAQLTVTADNKSKIIGQENPPLTITYTGFVNNDNENKLTTKPVISTTAVTLSPIGTYPITVSGAELSNYTYKYITGVLIVEAAPPLIIVPNAFTPNNDGINDTWDLKNIQSFPKNTVDIYNRYGEKVYSSIGYAVPWDGRRNGAQLPVGAYYYIINPKNGAKVISGSVTIIR